MATTHPTALITGASSGIGAVYADRLAARGHDLILVARRADRLDALAARLTQQHRVQVRPVVADLAQAQDLARIEQLLATEPVELLVNNAGLARLGPLAGAHVDDAMAQLSLNIVVLTRLTQAVLPGFKARQRGTLINIASVLALQSLPISAVYSGTKAYVLAFTRGLQDELAGTGVRLQVVLPGVTATDLWSAGISGVPLAALDPARVMSAEAMVDAALAGLARGEQVTWPSVEDEQLWDEFERGRMRLFGASQTGQVASRYLAG